MVSFGDYLLVGLIGFVLTILGVYLFVTTMMGVMNAKKTEATVINTDVGRSTTDSTYRYYPIIEYKYTIDGENYTNKNYKSGGQNTKSRTWAEDIVDDYEEGENIEIYYVPSNPKQSFIKKSFVTYPLILVGVGVFFLGLFYYNKDRFF